MGPGIALDPVGRGPCAQRGREAESLELERELSAGHSVWAQGCVSAPRSHMDA